MRVRILSFGKGTSPQFSPIFHNFPSQSPFWASSQPHTYTRTVYTLKIDKFVTAHLSWSGSQAWNSKGCASSGTAHCVVVLLGHSYVYQSEIFILCIRNTVNCWIEEEKLTLAPRQLIKFLLSLLRPIEYRWCLEPVIIPLAFKLKIEFVKNIKKIS